MEATAEALRMYNSLSVEDKNKKRIPSRHSQLIEMWKEESTARDTTKLRGIVKRVGEKSKAEKCRVRKAKNGVKYSVILNAKAGSR